jgi:hypothetical protein
MAPRLNTTAIIKKPVTKVVITAIKAFLGFAFNSGTSATST